MPQKLVILYTSSMEVRIVMMQALAGGFWCSTRHLKENMPLLYILQSKLKGLCNLNSFHSTIILSLTSVMQGLRILVPCLRLAGFIVRKRVIVGTLSINVQRDFKCSISAQDCSMQYRDGGNFCQWIMTADGQAEKKRHLKQTQTTCILVISQ